MTSCKYRMDGFSEKSLMALGDYYVYGLMDPRNGKFFYFGKGSGNRVFEHERESLKNEDSEKLKLKTIREIEGAGLEVKKIILHSNLSEAEAFAAEAALINTFNYIEGDGITNIVSGHHANDAMSVEEFEKYNGAELLSEEDIKHRIMVIKVNKLYHRSMSEKELYETVRGIWRASIQRARKAEYVLGVYNSLIVAVFKPTKWYVCEEAADFLPRQDIVLDEQTRKRIFFADEEYEQGISGDENKVYYLYKSIAALKLNQNAQNPITYLNM